MLSSAHVLKSTIYAMECIAEHSEGMSERLHDQTKRLDKTRECYVTGEESDISRSDAVMPIRPARKRGADVSEVVTEEREEGAAADACILLPAPVPCRKLYYMYIDCEAMSCAEGARNNDRPSDVILQRTTPSNWHRCVRRRPRVKDGFTVE
ncbi:hypothetical protein OH77DRAFT_231909 [Trametes cingulata]|nr:hypothetical protein OH77DRAFT_231909 [Trametes cingulata]